MAVPERGDQPAANINDPGRSDLAPTRPIGRVAIVDGGLPGRYLASGAVITDSTARCVTLLEELADLRAIVAPLIAGDTARAVCNALPADIAAVYLTSIDPRPADVIQAELARTRRLPVITNEQTTAIALTVAVLNLLTQAGKSPSASRLVIVESSPMPTLCPLLVAVGIGDITNWHPTDALAFPLRRIARLADAVIDPLADGVPLVEPSSDPDQPPLIAGGDPAFPLLALPGLLSAVLRAPDRPPDIDTYHACVLALVSCTPPGELLPSLLDPDLTPTLTRLAVRALTTGNERDQA